MQLSSYYQSYYQRASTSRPEDESNCRICRKLQAQAGELGGSRRNPGLSPASSNPSRLQPGLPPPAPAHGHAGHVRQHRSSVPALEAPERQQKKHRSSAHAALQLPQRQQAQQLALPGAHGQGSRRQSLEARNVSCSPSDLNVSDMAPPDASDLGLPGERDGHQQARAKHRLGSSRRPSAGRSPVSEASAGSLAHLLKAKYASKG